MNKIDKDNGNEKRRNWRAFKMTRDVTAPSTWLATRFVIVHTVDRRRHCDHISNKKNINPIGHGRIRLYAPNTQP